MDQYIERIVSQKTPPKMVALQTLACALLAVALTFALMVHPAGWLLVIVCFILLWQVNRRARREFEYLLAPEELTIDCIYNRKKRKQAENIRWNEVELCASMDAPTLYGYRKDKIECRDYSSRREGDRIYSLVIRREGRPVEIRISANLEMLEFFKRYLPRGSHTL